MTVLNNSIFRVGSAAVDLAFLGTVNVFSAFRPESLFQSGEIGFAFDATSTATLSTDSAGSIPVVAHGDMVGRIADLSGNNNHAIQATDLLKPRFISNGKNQVCFGGHTLITPQLNFTSTAVVTVVAQIRQQDTSVAGVVMEFGPSFAANNGSLNITSPNDVNTNNYGIGVRGTALGAYKTATKSDAGNDVITLKIDLSQSTLANEIIVRQNGALPTLTATLAGPCGTGNFGNYYFYFGKRNGLTLPGKYSLGKVIVIGRVLTTEELAAAEQWCAIGPQRVVAVVGDSTVASYLGYPALPSYLNIDQRLVAVPADTISQQKTRWTARSDKSAYEAVIVQVGLNDLNPAEASSVAIARLQDLVNTINLDVTCPIYISTMIPCLARLVTIYAGSAGTAYAKWQAMNEAISGGGATPITGVDYRISGHETSMNDGAGNLLAAYDSGDGIHPNDAGRMINSRSWFNSLQSAGFL